MPASFGYGENMKRVQTIIEQTEQQSPKANPNFGLTHAQVEALKKAGKSNADNGVRSKPYGQIIWDNTMTYFNLLNLVLGAVVIALGSYRNALFLLVILCNIVIGIAQEIRAKKPWISFRSFRNQKLPCCGRAWKQKLRWRKLCLVILCC